MDSQPARSPRTWTGENGPAPWSALVIKEIREILRDRRTVLTLVLMPCLVYPLLSVGFKTFFVSQTRSIVTSIQYVLLFRSPDERQLFFRILPPEENRAADPAKPAKPVSDDPLPDLFQGNDPADIEESLGETVVAPEVDIFVQSRVVDLGVVLDTDSRPELSPRNLAVDWKLVYVEGNARSEAALAYVRRRLDAANIQILSRRLEQLGSPQRVMPIQTTTAGLPNERALTSTLGAILPLVLIMMTMTGAVYPAIDLTAGERERGTMELLMAAPVSRLALLLAKYVAVMVVAILTAAVNIGMMTITIQTSGLQEALFPGFRFTVGTIAAIGGALILLASFFSAVLLVITSYARSFKEAQAYLIPLMLIALGPGLISFLPTVRLEGTLSVIPLLNIVLMIRDLLEGSLSLAWSAVVILSNAAYVLLTLAIASKIFGAESVLYATEGGSWSDTFRRPGQGRAIPAGRYIAVALVLSPALVLLQGATNAFTTEIQTRLISGAVLLALLFGVLPIFLCWWWRQTPTRALGLRLVGPVHALTALLLGLSLWPIAHELVLLADAVGLAPLSRDLIERGGELLDRLGTISLPLILVCLALVPAVAEEIFFRGFLMRGLAASIPPIAAVLVSALLFGLMHVVGAEILSPERFLPSSFLGLILGLVAWRTDSLLASMLVHVVHNSAALTVSEWGPAVGLAIEGSEHVPMQWLVGSVTVVIACLLVLSIKRKSPNGNPLEP